MLVADLTCAMDQIAPLRLAEAWDNVGLLVGDSQQQLHRLLLTIDYTPAVAKEAQDEQCDAVVAYHPLIFEGLKRITAPSLVYDAIQRGIAIYSPHTALDVAEGGTNDMLADALGLKERHPLRMAETKSASCKLVVFVPEEALEKVSSALFNAGAGRIGNYRCCSFQTPGRGTFFGDQSTNPAVGSRGQLEQVSEIRLETIVPFSKVSSVIRALRESHPYEEPAFDLNQLAAPPEGVGQGRIGDLAAPVSREELIARIKRELQLGHVLVAGPTSGAVSRVACLAGAGREHLLDALSQKAELYLTGEIPHHDALKAARQGCTVVATLHSNSERAVLRRLEASIRQRLPDLPILISKQDADPFAVR